MTAFTVRVYVNGSSPVVLQGGRDPFSLYIETTPHSGSGFDATPAKRIEIEPVDLEALPPGSDADFVYRHPLAADQM